MIISITCKGAAELISQSLDAPLSRWQRLALVIHLFICGPCGRFRRQSTLIQHAGQREPADLVGASLSETARERIKRSLRDEG